MTSYIIFDIMKPVFWKNLTKEPLTSFLGGRGARMALIRLCRTFSA